MKIKLPADVTRCSSVRQPQHGFVCAKAKC